MSLSLRRYHESPKNKSSFVLTTKNSVSRQRISPLNSSLALPKNPQIDIRLPSLSRASMRKSFSTFQSDRNTKFKLTTLQDKLEQIKANLNNTRQEAKETLEFIVLMRQNLVEKQLNSLHKDLKQQISGFHNLVKCTSNQNKLRSNDLRNDCNQLWDLTQGLKCQMFALRMKIDSLQIGMGYKE